VQDVAAADRFETSVTPKQCPAPRAAERSFSLTLNALRRFDFSISVVRSLFLKTDDPLSGHDG
jgi:hypothetical protein